MTTYEIIEAEPNTEAWHEWRRSVLSASRAPVIMQCAPRYYRTTTWDQLRGTVEVPEPSEQTRKAWAHGHQREAAYKQARPYVGESVNLQRGRYGASLDAANLDDPFGPMWWEIKAPTSKRSLMWTQMTDLDSPDPGGVREALPHIWWQLVHQAYVIGDPDGVCHLVVMNPTGTSRHRSLTISAHRLLADWPDLEEQWELFRAGGQPGLADEAWVTAAHAYLEADDNVKTWTEVKKRRRAKVLELASEEPDRAMGGGVKVVTAKREGSIDWKTMARDVLVGMDVDEFDSLAERYRKPDYSVTTIRRVK